MCACVSKGIKNGLERAADNGREIQRQSDRKTQSERWRERVKGVPPDNDKLSEQGSEPP